MRPEELRMPKGGFKRRHLTRAEFVRELIKDHPTIVVPSRAIGQRRLDTTPTSPKDGNR